MRKLLAGVLLGTLVSGTCGPLRAEGIARPPMAGAAGSAAPEERPAVPQAELDEALAHRIYEIATERPEALERRMWEVLTTYIGNPETVSLAVRMGSPLQTIAGRFPRIEVAMNGTEVKGLPVQRGFFVLKDVVLDLPKLFRDGKFRFRDKGSTDFLFEVTEDGLNQLLQEKGSKLKVRNARMRLEYDHITFQGDMKVLFFRNHVTVHGRLQPRHGTEVHFDPYHLRLDFLPVPGFVLSMIRRKINPVGDLKDFRFDVDIGAIETTKTRLFLASRAFEDFVHSEVRAEREGRPVVASRWPPPQLSRILAISDEVVRALPRGRLFVRRAGELTTRDDATPDTAF